MIGSPMSTKKPAAKPAPETAPAAPAPAPQPAAPIPHIVPTIGRVVHYRGKDGETRAAIVTRVYGPFCINVHVFAREPGDAEAGDKTSVTHADPAQEPACYPSWHWMPFQLGQAAKTSASDRILEHIVGNAGLPEADVACALARLAAAEHHRLDSDLKRCHG